MPAISNAGCDELICSKTVFHKLEAKKSWVLFFSKKAAQGFVKLSRKPGLTGQDVERI